MPYLHRLQTRSESTTIPAALKGAVLACTLPNKSKFNNDLKKVVNAKVDPDILGTMENGGEKVITILDDIFEKTAMGYVAEKFKVFMDIKRSSGTTIKQFIAKYESIVTGYDEDVGTLTQQPKHYNY